MLTGYLSGNLSFVFDAFESNSDDTMTGEEQALMARYQSYMKRNLFTLRDKRMASRVHDLLVKNPDSSFFFAFGAGHFVGPTSVLHHLEELGYTIRRVQRVERNKT